MTEEPKRVLIYRLGSLGDTLVALPALHLVARRFPGAERRLLTNTPVGRKAPPAAAILGDSGLVHGYFRYTVGTRSPQELLHLGRELRRWRPEVLLYLGAARGTRSARRDALFFRLCGVSRQIGVPLTEKMQANRWILPDGYFEPEAARLVRNLAEIGDIDLADQDAWDLRLTPAEHARAHAVLAPAGDRPIFAVSLGTKVQAKDWGRSNWQALLRSLAALYGDHALALFGASDEAQTSDFAAFGWRGHSASPILNLCGVLTPRESAAAFARVRILVGHDSGPVHLAAAVQTPCVAIFAARNLPRVWFPYGSRHRVLYHHVSCAGCGLETCLVEAKRCLFAISVSEVVGAVRSVLG